MKLALVLMINPHDLPFLKLHLPVYKDSFDGIIAIADNTEGYEAIDYVTSLGAKVTYVPWEYNWGDYATKLFDYAEHWGYDAAMRMDPDECLMPDAGYYIRNLLETEAALLVFPRHEFWGDRYHVRPIWPDDQARAWHLRRGIIVQGKKHEGIGFMDHGLSEHTTDPHCRVLRIRDPHLHIFHYGWSSPQAIYNAMVKYQKQAQIAAGGSPEVNFASDQPLATHVTIPFGEPQPLLPEDVGIYAPFSAEVDRSAH